jgi:hypothetical protein
VTGIPVVKELEAPQCGLDIFTAPALAVKSATKKPCPAACSQAAAVGRRPSVGGAGGAAVGTVRPDPMSHP